MPSRYVIRGKGFWTFSSFAGSRSRRFKSSRHRSSARPTRWTMKSSASSQRPSNSRKATSGSTIQNSVRWRRVLDFSARNVGPKQ